ncbi:unnamed protein product, partial [Amoebophrya sp. A25]|eukprot:GSA25T00016515001.1
MAAKNLKDNMVHEAGLDRDRDANTPRADDSVRRVVAFLRVLVQRIRDGIVNNEDDAQVLATNVYQMLEPLLEECNLLAIEAVDTIAISAKSGALLASGTIKQEVEEGQEQEDARLSVPYRKIMTRSLEDGALTEMKATSTTTRAVEQLQSMLSVYRLRSCELVHTFMLVTDMVCQFRQLWPECAALHISGLQILYRLGWAGNILEAGQRELKTIVDAGLQTRQTSSTGRSNPLPYPSREDHDVTGSQKNSGERRLPDSLYEAAFPAVATHCFHIATAKSVHASGGTEGFVWAISTLLLWMMDIRVEPDIDEDEGESTSCSGGEEDEIDDEERDDGEAFLSYDEAWNEASGRAGQHQVQQVQEGANKSEKSSTIAGGQDLQRRLDGLLRDFSGDKDIEGLHAKVIKCEDETDGLSTAKGSTRSVISDSLNLLNKEACAKTEGLGRDQEKPATSQHATARPEPHAVLFLKLLEDFRLMQSPQWRVRCACVSLASALLEVTTPEENENRVEDPRHKITTMKTTSTTVAGTNYISGDGKRNRCSSRSCGVDARSTWNHEDTFHDMSSAPMRFIDFGRYGKQTASTLRGETDKISDFHVSQEEHVDDHDPQEQDQDGEPHLSFPDAVVSRLSLLSAWSWRMRPSLQILSSATSLVRESASTVFCLGLADDWKKVRMTSRDLCISYQKGWTTEELDDDEDQRGADSGQEIEGVGVSSSTPASATAQSRYRVREVDIECVIDRLLSSTSEDQRELQLAALLGAIRWPRNGNPALDDNTKNPPDTSSENNITKVLLHKLIKTLVPLDFGLYPSYFITAQDEVDVGKSCANQNASSTLRATSSKTWDEPSSTMMLNPVADAAPALLDTYTHHLRYLQEDSSTTVDQRSGLPIFPLNYHNTDTSESYCSWTTSAASSRQSPSTANVEYSISKCFQNRQNKIDDGWHQDRRTSEQPPTHFIGQKKSDMDFNNRCTTLAKRIIQEIAVCDKEFLGSLLSLLEEGREPPGWSGASSRRTSTDKDNGATACLPQLVVCLCWVLEGASTSLEMLSQNDTNRLLCLAESWFGSEEHNPLNYAAAPRTKTTCAGASNGKARAWASMNGSRWHSAIFLALFGKLEPVFQRCSRKRRLRRLVPQIIIPLLSNAKSAVGAAACRALSTGLGYNKDSSCNMPRWGKKNREGFHDEKSCKTLRAPSCLEQQGLEVSSSGHAWLQRLVSDNADYILDHVTLRVLYSTTSPQSCHFDRHQIASLSHTVVFALSKHYDDPTNGMLPAQTRLFLSDFVNVLLSIVETDHLS